MKDKKILKIIRWLIILIIIITIFLLFTNKSIDLCENVTGCKHHLCKRNATNSLNMATYYYEEYRICKIKEYEEKKTK